LDALTNLGIWGDDKQVCDGRVKKYYVPFGLIATGVAGCTVEIKEVEPS